MLNENKEVFTLLLILIGGSEINLYQAGDVGVDRYHQDWVQYLFYISRWQCFEAHNVYNTLIKELYFRK